MSKPSDTAASKLVRDAMQETRGRLDQLTQSELNIQINISRAIVVAIFHLFMPFTFPISLCLKNKAYRNMWLGWCLEARLRGVFLVVILPTILWAVTIAYIVRPPDLEAESAGAVTLAELLFCMTLSLIRAILIGTKYAYFSETEWNDFATSDPVTAKRLSGRQILLQAWLRPDVGILTHELLSASARQQLDLNKYCFKFSKDVLDDVEAWLRPALAALPEAAVKSAQLATSADMQARPNSSVLPADQGGRVQATDGPVKQLALEKRWRQSAGWHPNSESPSFRLSTAMMAMLLRSNQETQPDTVLLVSGLAAGFIALLPWLLHVAVYGWRSLTVMPAWAWCERIGISWAILESQLLLILFALCSSVGYHRQAKLAEAVTKLMQPRVKIQAKRARAMRVHHFLSKKGAAANAIDTAAAPSSAAAAAAATEPEGPTSTVLPPLIDLSYPSNAFTWYRMRMLMADVGKRFEARINVFLLLSTIIALAVDTQLVMQIMQSDTLMTVEDPRVVSNTFAYLSSIANTGILTVAIIGCIVFGSTANAEVANQEAAFAAAAIEVEEVAIDVRAVCAEAKSGGTMARSAAAGVGMLGADLGKSAQRRESSLALSADELARAQAHTQAVLDGMVMQPELLPEKPARRKSSVARNPILVTSSDANSSIDTGDDSDSSGQNPVPMQSLGQFISRSIMVACMPRQVKLQMQRMSAEELETMLQELATTVSMLNTVQRAVTAQDKVKPVQVLGLRAEPGLARGLMAFGASASGFLLQPLPQVIGVLADAFA